MPSFAQRLLRILRVLAATAAVLATGAAAAYFTAVWHKANPPSAEREEGQDDGEKIRRAGDEILIPAAAAKRMGMRTGPASTAARPIQLPPFQGTLALDSNSLARVHSRFPGEVTALGETAPEPNTAGYPPRPLRYGDRVRKGDLLAVVWSKDLGEKKSELVDAVSKLRTDELTLRKLEDADRTGSVPERSLVEARRNVESDRVAVDRAERTLRAWRLSDDEIAAVRAEAGKLGKADGKRGDQAQWARVEVRSPRDGVILEKNVVVGDIIDTSADLFKVGDLSRLVVWAHVYEEDLPLLQRLPKPVPWTVKLSARPEVSFAGTLDHVGAVIDPNQHTALVTGQVENPDGELRVGQFVTVSVEMPPQTGEVEVPADAVVEDGRESVIFVQADDKGERFRLRKVQVLRRFREVIYVRADQGGVRPGQRVITSGALLLREAMDTLPKDTEAVAQTPGKSE